jgi:putative membrane protein
VTFLRMLIDFIRGALIGAVEVIPGVSGGTVALIIGVYETVIDSAEHLVSGVVRSATDGLRRRGMRRAKEHFSRVRWSVILPLLVGMFVAIVVASAVIAPLVETYPVQSRALFAGLIIASLIVPIRMVGKRWKVREVVIAAVVAVVMFLLLGIPAAAPVDPPLWLVLIAAAVAVCALVLPGVSGSFLLVTVGMYAPTLAAVNDRNFTYLGVFVLGAILGLSLFVSGLQWLLKHRHRITLTVMTGLMVGSLRALWPWQTEEGELLAPAADLPSALGLFVVGIVAVAALIAGESALVRRRRASGDDVLHPDSQGQ